MTALAGTIADVRRDGDETMTRATAPQPADRYRESSRYVLDLLLASDPDELVERLALVAIDAIEERDGAREMVSVLLEQVYVLNATLDREREKNDRLRDELRAARSPHRKAAA
jgi:hypothetical protein